MFTNWVRNKIKIEIIIISALLAGTALFLISANSSKIKHPAFNIQLKAAEKMLQAEEIIYQAKKKRNLQIESKLDPNQTALIGQEYTKLTTTLGNLKAKRTATNPDFAALMVRYFTRLNLVKGDKIAVGASGSFPGLILAVLSASQTMDLEVELIYSLGSSMYGANIPNFSFIEMLKELREAKILDYKISAISFGGDNDRADNLFFDQNKDAFFKIAENVNLPLIYADNLEASIKQRIAILNKNSQANKFKTFINIGGASANFGNTSASVKFENGLTIPGKLKTDYAKNGLLSYFLKQNIPVIHLLNIENLARENGIQIDPVPLPKPGQADVYYIINYNKYLISSLLLIIIIPLLLAKCWTKSNQSRRIKDEI
ncbi:MAG: poly-gamma-glutamate system protein [Bacillota bacterium]